MFGLFFQFVFWPLLSIKRPKHKLEKRPNIEAKRPRGQKRGQYHKLVQWRNEPFLGPRSAIEVFFQARAYVMNKKVDSNRAVIDERPKGPIEKRKRNLKFFSPVSREERETGNSFRQFREGKENSKRICSTFERRKRNRKFLSLVSRGKREF